jgi:hypothetical protein
MLHKPNNWFHQKRPESPGLAFADLPMDPIEGIGGISEIVSGHVPTIAEIHGDATNMQVGSQSAPSHIVEAQCPEELRDVKFIDCRIISEIPRLISRQGSRIPPFEEKPEGTIAPQSYARSGSEGYLGIGSPASNALITSPGMVVRFKSGPVFEAQVNPIG